MNGRSGPTPAWPFTMLKGQDRVTLVAGEDLRYSLTGPEIESWFPDFFRRMDGTVPLAELLETVAAPHREEARALVAQLHDERLLTDPLPRDVPLRKSVELRVHGAGVVRQLLDVTSVPEVAAEAAVLEVLCQDTLAFDEAITFGRRCRARRTPWIWVSHGAMARGYVSPVFLPGIGPCMDCLLRHFQRLSPAGDLYDELIAHGQGGGRWDGVPFPAEAVRILEALVRWKQRRLVDEVPPTALYDLHVLELEPMSVSNHPVMIHPDCDHDDEGSAP